MIQERKRIIPEEENDLEAKDQMRNVKRLNVRCLGKKRDYFYRERSEKNEKKLRTLHIDKYTAQWISRYLKVSRIKNCQMELSRSYREVSIAK